jgi:hypothetical protein
MPMSDSHTRIMMHGGIIKNANANAAKTKVKPTPI